MRILITVMLTTMFAWLAFADVPASPTDIGVGELLKETGGVVAAWQLGWLAGLTALINLLINLLRFPAINNVFVDNEILWTKPLISAALGAGLGGLSSYATNQDPLMAIGAGIMAGIMATGTHEFLNKRKARKRQK